MSIVPSREEALFSAALAQPAAERAQFLARECGADANLLGRLMALVVAHQGSDSLLGPVPMPRPVMPAEEEPGRTIGRYKLLEKLGEGGCGAVWAAEQREPVKRRVALKIIKLGMDTRQVIARFEAERQALAMMDHPNIAKMLDAGATESGRPYFVMELVRGIPITTYADENNLTTGERLGLLIKVCHAIQHAHQKGIIHRDIKPSNVLVTLHDGEPVPKVIDFGIAKATQHELTDKTIYTKFQQFIGTPAYMSPEQAEMSGLDIDTRSDIYSLGVLLYELVTGRTPFDSKELLQQGVDEIRRTIREKDPPRPSVRILTLQHGELTTAARRRSTDARKLIATVRGDLDWVAMKCLEKDRTRRYETANGLASDIQRYLHNEPVTARPPSPAYRVRKFVRRHRFGFAAAALVGLSLIGGLAVATTSLYREKAARRQATAAEQAERAGRQRAQSAEAVARGAEHLAAEARLNAERLLAFIFTDMGEQLDEIGQLPLQRKLVRHVLDYYEHLRPALQTPETRAGHALAITGISTSGWLSIGRSPEFQLGDSRARERFEQALAMMRELEENGPLTPFMRVAYAGVLWGLAGQYFREARPAAAIPLLEQAERILMPALADPRWGEWADRFTTKLIMGRAAQIGFAATTSGERDEHVAELRRALARIEGSRARHTRSAILIAVDVKVRLASALFARGEAESKEARQLNDSARAEIDDLLKREPFLIWGRTQYALTSRNLARFARPAWHFQEVRAKMDEAIGELRVVAKSDPAGWGANSYLPDTLAWPAAGGRRFSLHWMFGDFAAAEADLREGIWFWTQPSAPPETRRKLVRAHESLAQLMAAIGRDAEAALQLREANVAFTRMLEERPWQTELQRQAYRSEREYYWRQTEMERLRWPAVRASAEHALRVGARATEESEDSVQSPEQATRAQLWKAAFHMGDYDAAWRELKLLPRPHDVLPPTATIDARFIRVGRLLNRIHVSARAGERNRARDEIVRIWREVEDVFAAGPDYLFNQVQTARALSIRAEIDGTPVDKREWLERAFAYLQPAAAAGRLTRYEREVLLAGIEKQLAALPGTETP